MSEFPQVRKVLVPTDFSELSTNAVHVADRVAFERGAELTLLHVHPIVQTAFLDLTYTEPPEKLAESIRFLEDKITHLAKSLKTPMDRIASKVLIGNPVEIIAAESETHGLLVISTHGRTGLSHLLLGSVAERVVRVARCSLLVVK